MKKFIITTSAISALVLAGTASAQSGAVRVAPGMIMPERPSFENQFMVNITPNGEATIRGTISAINGNVISVKSWGGEWMIRVSSSTQINVPKRPYFMMGGEEMSIMRMAMPTPVLSTSTQPSKLVVGDFIGAFGRVAENASWTIEAKLVNNRAPMPIPRPLPLPYPMPPCAAGTDALKVKCLPPIMMDNQRDKMKSMEKDLQKMMQGEMNKGGRQEYRAVNNSSAGDADALRRAREMLEKQMQTATGASAEAIKQSLMQINAISAGLNSGVNIAPTSTR